MTRLAAAFVIATVACSTPACATYRDQVVRSQRALDQNDEARALALLRNVEREATTGTPEEQAEYAYLRGIASYRLGDRAEARHWLARAKAYEESSTEVLAVDYKRRLNEALDELNQAVYANVAAGLAKSGAAKKP